MTDQSAHMQMFFGEVRDVRDPNGASGKVKITVHGHHNVGDNPVAEEDLPWAHCVMNNSPSLNGHGHTTNYLPGSTIIGFWADPETKQIPIIIGSIHRSGLPKYNGT